MKPEGRALAIAALLRLHPPQVVVEMLRDLEAGKSSAEVTLNAYRRDPTSPAENQTPERRTDGRSE